MFYPMIKRIGCIISILIYILISCESDKLNLDENWIKIKYYTNSLDSERKIIAADTLNVAINDEFILGIYTQSQPGIKSRIFNKTDDDKFTDVTDLPGEATFRGYFEEDGVQRKINEIQLSFNENIFNSGDEVEFLIKVESSSEMIEKNLIIKVK